MNGRRQLRWMLVLTLSACAGAPSSTARMDGSPSVPSAVDASAPAPTPLESIAPFRTASALAGATSWIAYQAGSTADRQAERIRIVRPDGTDDHELFGEVPYVKHLHPAWSPDGQQIAFGVEGGGPDRIYVGNVDGSDVRILAECRDADCVGLGHPVWSPDGTTIVARFDGGPMTDRGPTQLGLALVDVVSGDYELITLQGTEYQDIYPRWSPDGRQLVFWREQTGPDGEQVAVFVMDIDDTEARQLTPWELRAGDPDWSPDGSWIVFGTHPLRGHEDGTWPSNLYLIRPDGTDMTQLTDFGEGDDRATHPRWSPDGRAILYVRVGSAGHPREIWAMSADGSQDSIAVPPVAGRLYTHPAMQPTADQ